MGRPGRVPGRRKGREGGREASRESGVLPSLPPAWAAKLRREWRRLNALSPSEDPLSSAELDRAAAALLSLQRGLTGDRRLVGASYMDDPALLGAYLLWYWPASFLQVRRALMGALKALSPNQALSPASPGWMPRRVLDLGAGPGPASVASAFLGAEEILAVDRSARALSLFQSLSRELLPGVTTTAYQTGKDDSLLPGDILNSKAFDLVIISHTLNELALSNDPRARLGRRREAVEKLLDCLDEQGILLILEPALLLTSRELLALRDEMLSHGRTVLAPCLWKGPCPALSAGQGQSCHDAFPWEATREIEALADRTGLDRAELKMTWMAFLSKSSGAELASTGTELTYTGTELPQTLLACVVSDPMLNKAGRTRYVLCGPEGRYTLSARLSELSPACAAFASLKRMDIVSVERPERREGGGLGLNAESLLRVIG